MREGSLEAPTRHPIAWRDADFYDEEKLDAEIRRAFDICHGCRRCFNLCDSFPRLFDLVDDSASGELDSVSSADFKPVVDACTLCDLCFMVKCPYVPPHEFNLDFPHLMLRYRAVQHKKGEIPKIQQRLSETDKNGALGCSASTLANWACSCSNGLSRPVMQALTGIDKNAALPRFNNTPLGDQKQTFTINTAAPAYGRKAVIYATCSGEYHNAELGLATARVLARNGVEVRFVYPGCCGMPQLEHGDIARVAEGAKKIAAELASLIEAGYDIVSPVASCSLMLKFEWPLIEPDDENVRKLSQATFDVSEYLVDIAAKEGISDGLKPLEGGVTLHIACHARAQNMGRKGAAMLKLIPDTEVKVIERCSGHGGSWGVYKGNYDVALKVGKPVARDTAKQASRFVVSECPLAREHILQGVEILDPTQPAAARDAGGIQVQHPIQLMALSYQENE
ncbi:MAG: glycerol-3-phosphate dehydrogenase [Rhodospirillales bacterium]|nr:glycerol-3-phosphate dehydrogenase [Rhodospirillales bacterium]